ncbi:MAG: response regulator [Bacillota bacterium]
MSYILVIDDEQYICWLVEEALTAAGYKVKTATDWQKGLETAAAERPALVLLDLKLPGTEGRALLKEIERLAVGVPIVIMTGDVATCAGPTVAGYLIKPFDLDDLRCLVQKTVPFLP